MENERMTVQKYVVNKNVKTKNKKYKTESIPERLPCSSDRSLTTGKKGKKKERKRRRERGVLKNIK
jgi:hypothetical protein